LPQDADGEIVVRNIASGAEGAHLEVIVRQFPPDDPGKPPSFRLPRASVTTGFL
jgi:hypothetical protein